MQIRVGIKTGDLVQLDHSVLKIKSDGAMKAKLPSAGKWITIPAGGTATVRAVNAGVMLEAQGVTTNLGPTTLLQTDNPKGILQVSSNATSKSPAKATQYRGVLQITATRSALRLVLLTDLEDYVQGVLQSEVPSYYKPEAMKAQAVLARTYGIRPRLPHGQDGFDVCDSYLHCQAFYGVRSLTAAQKQAISATKGELLLHDGKPALALFSACAGGHTENYENCFSDPVTNAFPPPAIPYLKGVPEGRLPSGYPDEKALRLLHDLREPATVDAWSMQHFRWRVTIAADALEAHMHHVVDTLRQDPQFGPFIKPPPSGKFGHIKGFKVLRRGVAGTAIDLQVDTSEGPWLISKELTIRSAFENPDVKLKRLRSARLFFDHKQDKLGLLSSVTISGFGSGHGVGLQQVGAQGLALQGKTYKQIIAHYYPGTTVGKCAAAATKE